MNINGLNGRHKRSHLRHWIKSTRPDLLILVDTRLTTSAALLAKSLGASSCTMSATSTRPGGIALLSFSPLLIPMETLISSHHMLGVTFQMDSLMLKVVGVYVPVTGSDRTFFLSDSLAPFLLSMQWSDNIILCGDFNFVECPSLDKSSPTSYSGGGDTAILSSATHSLGLSDAFRLLHPLRKEFTFYSASRKSSSRIDRIYISHSLSNDILKFKHLYVHSNISDHSFGCSISLPSPLVQPQLKNDLWRLNTSNINKPSLSREVKEVCRTFIQMANPPIFWWDDFKDKLRTICIRHSILESSRR